MIISTTTSPLQKPDFGHRTSLRNALVRPNAVQHRTIDNAVTSKRLPLRHESRRLACRSPRRGGLPGSGNSGRRHPPGGRDGQCGTAVDLHGQGSLSSGAGGPARAPAGRSQRAALRSAPPGRPDRHNVPTRSGHAGGGHAGTGQPGLPGRAVAGARQAVPGTRRPE